MFNRVLLSLTCALLLVSAGCAKKKETKEVKMETDDSTTKVKVEKTEK